MNDESRKAVQAVLDAITPLLFKGADVMIKMNAVDANAALFSGEEGKILSSIAAVCPKEERSRLMFRSGACMPFGQHAGQKEKANISAREVPDATAGRKTVERRVYGALTEGTLKVLTKAGKEGVTNQQVAAELHITGAQSSSLLHSLFSSNRAGRDPIENPDKRSPKYRYFVPPES